MSINSLKRTSMLVRFVKLLLARSARGAVVSGTTVNVACWLVTVAPPYNAPMNARMAHYMMNQSVPLNAVQLQALKVDDVDVCQISRPQLAAILHAVRLGCVEMEFQIHSKPVACQEGPVRRFFHSTIELLHDDVVSSRNRPLPGKGKGRSSRMHLPTEKQVGPP